MKTFSTDGLRRLVSLLLLVIWSDMTLSGDASNSGGPTLTLAPIVPRVEIEANLEDLPESEHAALAKIIAAARVIDSIAFRYTAAGNVATLIRLAGDESEEGRLRLGGFLARMSPWLDDGSAFVGGDVGAPPPQPGYPSDATKDEVAHWWSQLPAAERAVAKSPYSVIRRGADGQLLAVPYSIAFGDDLARAAVLLRQSAAATNNSSFTAFPDFSLERTADR